MIRVAVIDNEDAARSMMERLLRQEGFQVTTFQAGKPFLASMRQAPFDLVFIDLKLPDIEGLEVLRLVKQAHWDTEAIITGQASVDTVVEATRKGAFHYLTKPCRWDDIILMVRRARKEIESKDENIKPDRETDSTRLTPGFVGASKAMQDIFALIKKLALVNCNVLIEAETGTGKQLAARAIHELSPRRDNPFVYFNCGGFNEELICSELFGHEKGSFTGAAGMKIGLLESAGGGTVLLDEIGEMPLSMQIKLLHVLQERQVLRVGGTKPIDLDVRIIAATNRNLKQLIRKGLFREDLYYRLHVVGIQLPRLRERPEDIPPLISHFIKKFNSSFGKKVRRISPQALELLMAYSFPGNVRELENIIQRSVALADGDTLEIEDLSAKFQETVGGDPGGESLFSLEAVERQHIKKVLQKTAYNKKLASHILKIPRTTLWRKMKKYGLAETEDKNLNP
ncbi:transcriptional regulatory protein ZraR [bacterium BMS3Bbin14]|nr:transcriptional regulatory protein ZraR [bacterium BMS3Abin13]GBE51920.1 transcriptional regulatory protein ZraR [bacterium BMS3Bbin14]HDO30028.1 sigma-54-dependent Fis family transcriptional regulator [Desulfobacteraceae bacterium]